jgi:hypothetical protein
MKRNTLKSDKIDKNMRDVKIPCVECGKKLKFCIKGETVIEGGEGFIATNFPGAVCHDCIESLLGKVADPPGLVCIKSLNPVIAQECLSNFEFILPLPDAVNFFGLLFPENQFIMPENDD